MLIAFIVVVGLSLLILGHETGHFLAAKFFGLRVDEFGFGFPPRIAARKMGETEYSLNWLPFGGFVKIAGERGEFAMVEKTDLESHPTPDTSKMFYAQPTWKKSVVMLAGVSINFLLGWFFLSLTLMIGAPQALVIREIQPDSPAAAAGLAAGDIFKGYTEARPFIAYVNAHRGEKLSFTLLRGSKEFSATMIPRVVTGPNEGALGVGLSETGAAAESFPDALRHGLRNTGIIFWLTIQGFYELLRQLFFHVALLPGVVGPVGIFGVAEETGKVGLIYLLQFIGIISINLAVVNLIPFPALDGGRFLMVLIEKIKGSAISAKVEAWINGLGFAFLLILMLLLTVRDIKSLF